tara:strand:+ start:34 stop:207 length:174 start_codon:yes stop_codon:yes gene_type:complete
MEKIQKVQVLLRWMPNVREAAQVLSNKTGIPTSVHSEIAMREYLAKFEIPVEEPKVD